LEKLRLTLKNLRSSAYSSDYLANPSRPAQPDSLSAITQLTHNMKKLRKSLLKQQEAPEGSSPEEMMLYHKLLSGLKRTSRKSYAEPAMRQADQSELNALSHLTNQMHSIADALESPEENVLHRNAHAQSRMLHRMNHVLEAMGDEMDAKKQAHYERMMSVLLKQHLSDPDYRDSLYYHLADHANRLNRARRDEEFADQLNRGLLYRDLNTHVGDEYYDFSTGAALSAPYHAANTKVQQNSLSDALNAAAKFKTTNKQSTEDLRSNLSKFVRK